MNILKICILLLISWYSLIKTF